MMKIVKKILKIIGWVFLSILLIVLLALVAIQTPPVKKIIKNIAQNQVNKFLYAELYVGEITGNFFTHLGLNDVILFSENKDTIAYISEVKLRYNLIPLLSNEINVDEVIIEKPYIYIEQFNDSTWNFAKIARPSENTDTTSSEFNFLVQLNKLKLNEGKIKINALDTIIPKKIDNLFIDLSGHYSTNDIKADLNNLQLITTAPDIELKKLSLFAEGNLKDIIHLNDLNIETRENKINIKGEYNFDTNKKSQLELATSPIILEEFQAFLPADFHLKPKPQISLNAEMEAEKLSLDLKIDDNSQGLELQLLSYHLIEYLSDTNSRSVSYDLNADINNVDLRYWLDNNNLAYIIEGNLKANGEGFDPEYIIAQVEGDFKDILVYNYPITKLNLEANYNKGDVDGVINGSGAFGYLHVVPHLKQILSNNPQYRLNLLTKNFDLSAIMGNQQYKTDVDLQASINGSGFELNKINANAEIEISPSTAMGFRVDTLYGNVNFAKENLLINSFYIETLSAKVNADGNYNLKGNSDLNLEVIVDNMEEIAAFIGIDSIETSLDLSLNVTGVPDNLKADLKADLGKSSFKNLVVVDSVNINAIATLQDTNINIDGNLITDKLIVSGFNLDKVTIKAETDTKDINLDLNVNSLDLQTQINGMVQLGEIIKITLADLWLNYKDYNWNLADDTARIEIGNNEYIVDNFHLKSGEIDSIQYIYADGKINLSGEQDFKLNIKDVNIGQILKLLGQKEMFSGLLNFDISVDGPAESPIFSGNLDVQNANLQNYIFDTLNANFAYKDKFFQLEFNAIPLDNGEFHIEGKLPMDIALDSMRFDVIPKNTDPIYAKVFINNFPLGIINIILPVDEAAGYIESNITMNGSLEKPDITGKLNIVDGKLRLEQYGINYHNIQSDINLTAESVQIDTFLIESNDGSMRINGGAKFLSELYKAQLENSDIKIKFNRFNPIDHKQYNMELSGEIDLNANNDSATFSGDIEIPEMQVYLPAVLSLLGKISPSEMPKPLLVMQLEKENIYADSVVYTFSADTSTKASANDTINKLNFLNNLQGKLRVRIPRNTWIRNDDFRVELSGDVEVIKHQSFFELFGSIDVVRGQYNLLGKVFVIETGIITFQGGEKIDPLLNVEAKYTFRDQDRTSKDLMLSVTGDLNSPVISFTLDGQSVSEGDALSYIIFGTSLDALASGQQASLGSADAGSLAGAVASSLISSQLTKFLGNTFNVDYIEFKGSGSFDNASFTVGKYITNKLFVSYEQVIGSIQDNDVARYEMRMEYELFKFLFLQLVSSPITNGFDVIFKFNSK